MVGWNIGRAGCPRKSRLALGVVLLSLVLLLACRQTAQTPGENKAPGSATPAAPAATATPTAIPTATPTPSPTPEPRAATVNGQPILLATYTAELARYQLWLSDTLSTTALSTLTLDALIQQTLVEQEAQTRGLAVDPAQLEAQLNETIAAMGGAEAYAAWLAQNGWTDEIYRQALAAEMLTGLVIEAVTADVPYTTEFVRARVIQANDLATAQAALLQLQNGGDFLTVLDLYSAEPNKAITRGDIGFFDRGTLLVPEIETAAFALEPGAISDILTVTRPDGTTVYYIVQTTAREPFRPYSSERRAALVRQAFEAWLADRRAHSDIQIEANQP